MRYVRVSPAQLLPMFPRLSLFATLACLSLIALPLTASAAERSTAVSQSSQTERSESTTAETKAAADQLLQQGREQYKNSQFRLALQSWEEALAIYRKLVDRQGEAYALGNLGVAYKSLGQYQKAIDFHEQSLAIAREIGYRQGEAKSLGNLGIAYDALGQYQKAIDFHEQSLAIAREIGDRQWEAGSLNNLGSALLASNQFAAATEQLFTAVQIHESLRDAKFTDTQKRSLYDTQASTFRLLQRSLISQNDISKALEISERGRARAFVELLSSQQSADGSNPTAPPLPTVAQIQQIAKTENATIVQYSNIFDRFLYIYVVKPTGEIAFRQAPLGDQTDSSPIAMLNAPLFRGGAAQPAETLVSGLVNNARSDLLVSGSVAITSTGEDSPDHRLSELHKLLIDPIADLLPTNETDRIIFVPQGSLFLVPFPALKDANGDYLIQHHTVLTAPSIQVLASTQQQRSPLPAKPTDVLVVGNPTMPNIPNISLPNLPGAEAEAKTIAQFFGTQALTGAAATKAKVVQQMAQAQIIHLATHGLLQYGDPQASGIRDIPGAIALAPSGSDNGLLTSAEILQLQLKAQLIVLSACDTGRGDITGDGVVGLSRALITAGVPSIIVSLWSVPDAPTSELMAEFYRQWQQQPDKAQALRQAMLITMQSHPDPRDWAAFTLIGEAEAKP